MSETTKQKLAKDVLLRLKYRGYCWSFLEPGSTMKIEDFVLYCKFYLCKQNKLLMNDPVWDRYQSDEEIMVEYFAHMFANEEEQRKRFETQINAQGQEVDEIYDWLDSKMEELKEENDKKLEEAPEKVSFSPDEGEVNG